VFERANVNDKLLITMTHTETALWNRILNFQFDQPDTSFTFSTRLARENGWSKTYADRVILEYKKFLFLSVISPGALTPSDTVDQAWHLHLTYTKSYWVDLCRDTLHRDFHHNPTKGGVAEAQKFDGYYTSLQTLYEQYFGTRPPADIWQPNDERFSDINFQRVNLRKYWLVKRPSVKQWQVMTVCTLVVIAGVSIQATGSLLPMYVVIGMCVFFIYRAIKSKGSSNNSDGSGGSGCSADSSSGHGHHGGDSGCSSGCSGCSGSGCSGCGGGGD
jgi:hypothetical protein